MAKDAGLPLGAIWDGAGTRFSICSAHAKAVELCLFDRPEASAESERIPLEKADDGVWSVYLPECGPGQLYGYRVDGPFAPQDGHRYNRAKLLVDPYAHAVTGEPRPDPSVYAYLPGQNPDLSSNGANSAGAMPKALVVDPSFDWQGVERPRLPWADTVIYEAHLKGLTYRHPEVPADRRGKYLGLAAEPVVAHLKRLGVTTIELLPLCQFASEDHLLAGGRRNYWGYSPLAYLAPHAAYASGSRGEQVAELKTMVRELHRQGLEVIVDMVFNHSVEGGAGGPTYSFRGIDNRGYYRLDPWHPRRYLDYTGCGHTLDVDQPAVRRLVLDALRHWAGELGVDGFRLDLATSLGRDGGYFQTRASLFRSIAEDELLAGLKWIAEPWDLGPGGYQLGSFPGYFAEWNDRYRNTARRFWRGERRGDITGELARRLSGSADLFPAKAPLASINYICGHDGFTLADLVSYERKHNEANGENNRDGNNENFSRNWGAEGPTEDSEILGDRRRTRINLLATLMLSLGVPMIAHGDEIGRSQQGNNNPYCQDNEIAWVDWENADWEFFESIVPLLAMRRDHPVLRRAASWEEGQDLHFFGLRGEKLGAEQWSSPDHAAFGMRLEPAASEREDGILALFNGNERAVNFRLPPEIAERQVSLLVYSAWPTTPESAANGLADWTVEGLTLAIFALGKAGQGAE
jgi:isoamylase